MKKYSSSKELCTIYFTRHGETDWNKQGMIQGQQDIPLNQQGKKQAFELHKKLQHLKFDAIFSSDLFRAKETAQIIAKERKLIVKTTQLLKERSLGKVEGITFTKYKKKFLEIIDLKNRERLEKKYQIEKSDKVISRILTFIRETAFAYPGKTLLVVSHGTILRMMLAKLGLIAVENYWKIHIKNTGYIKVKTDGSDIFLEHTEGVLMP